MKFKEEKYEIQRGEISSKERRNIKFKEEIQLNEPKLILGGTYLQLVLVIITFIPGHPTAHLNQINLKA